MVMVLVCEYKRVGRPSVGIATSTSKKKSHVQGTVGGVHPFIFNTSKESYGSVG